MNSNYSKDQDGSLNPLPCNFHRERAKLWLPALLLGVFSNLSLAEETLTVPLDSADMMLTAMMHPQDVLGGSLKSDVKRIVWSTGANVNPQILQQPEPQSLNTGETLSLNVSAGAGNPRYFWRHNGVPLMDQTGPTLEIKDSTLSQSGWYSVLVNDGGSFVLSDSVYVDVHLGQLSAAVSPQ